MPTVTAMEKTDTFCAASQKKKKKLLTTNDFWYKGLKYSLPLETQVKNGVEWGTGHNVGVLTKRRNQI